MSDISTETAPATAIGTPARKELMEETFARARANHERVAQGLEPDLSPLRTRGPVVSQPDFIVATTSSISDCPICRASSW